jgi:hypothetical protein
MEHIWSTTNRQWPDSSVIDTRLLWLFAPAPLTPCLATFHLFQTSKSLESEFVLGPMGAVPILIFQFVQRLPVSLMLV